jgi:hypothetical protein
MKWFKEPLLHFLVLGGLIFVLYTWLTPDGPAEDEIVVTRGQQEHLAVTFTRTWQRPPTESEFSALVDDWVREEIAWREGVRMGLDSGDTVIRRRLRQKLELLAEDVVAQTLPDDAALQAWLDGHPADYTQEARYTFSQVYFSPDRRGAATALDAEQALLLLRTPDAALDPATMGDPLPLPRQLENEREGAIAAQFGLVFSEALAGLAQGEWQGPVESGYGLHLVRVEDVSPGRPLGLEEARAQVLRDWQNQRRIESLEQMYQRLAEQYRVTIEPRQPVAAD